MHGYGDICQSVTELAGELDAPIGVEEYRTFNRCLDDAIADAVTEFGHLRDQVMSADGASAMNQRLGFLAHDLRNLLNTAILARGASSPSSYLEKRPLSAPPRKLVITA